MHIKINIGCKKYICIFQKGSKTTTKMPTATRSNNSMSHFHYIKALLKNKNQNSKETTLILFFQKSRFTYNNIKPVTIPNNYCCLYYCTSEGPNSIRAFLYNMYNRQSCLQYRKTTQRLDESIIYK